MASIRKRGDKWQVQIRRSGCQPIARSFSKRELAVSWMRQKEFEIERGDLSVFSRSLQTTTLADILERYEREVTTKKRGCASERYSIRTIRQHQVSKHTLARLTSDHIAGFRDERLKLVKPSSVRRQLDVLRHCLTVAMHEWGFPMKANPVEMITLPKLGKARSRRLTEHERNRVFQSLGKGPAYLGPVIELALETGMRRGEIVQLEWENIDLDNRTVFLPLTKNGDSRLVPLSPRALEVLRQLKATHSRVFPALTGNAVRLAWERLKRRAGLVDFRFHDLRHEAISRLFEKGLSIPEVALVSGHKDPRMLFRYTHLKAEDIAEKL